MPFCTVDSSSKVHVQKQALPLLDQVWLSSDAVVIDDARVKTRWRCTRELADALTFASPSTQPAVMLRSICAHAVVTCSSK